MGIVAVVFVLLLLFLTGAIVPALWIVAVLLGIVLLLWAVAEFVKSDFGILLLAMGGLSLLSWWLTAPPIWLDVVIGLAVCGVLVAMIAPRVKTWINKR